MFFLFVCFLLLMLGFVEYVLLFKAFTSFSYVQPFFVCSFAVAWVCRINAPFQSVNVSLIVYVFAVFFVLYVYPV